jgi:DNA-binding LytR/AlgR family response regulator
VAIKAIYLSCLIVNSQDTFLIRRFRFHKLHTQVSIQLPAVIINEIFTILKTYVMQKLATFFTTWKGQSTKITLDDLLFVEMMEDSCVLHLKDSRVMAEDSAEKIMSYLPEDSFLRVRHKYLVNLRYITNINEDYVYVEDIRINLRSRAQRAH